jgi:hypothetical protein
LPFTAWLESGEELQLACIKGLFEIFQKKATEQTSQHANVQEEIRPARDPTRSIGRKTAAWNDAMQMRVMEEILPPGMQDGEKANLRTQVLGVSGNGAQRLAHRSEQNIVDELLILVGDRSDWLWDRKDDVEVADVEKLGSTVFQPFSASQRLALWAVAVSATIVTNALVVTVVTLLDVTTKRCRSTLLDRRHDATLCG